VGRRSLTKLAVRRLTENPLSGVSASIICICLAQIACTSRRTFELFLHMRGAEYVLMSKHFPSVACCVSHLADGNFPLHRKPTNVAGQWPRSLYVVGDSRIAFAEESHGTSEDVGRGTTPEDVVAQEVCVS